MEPIILAIDTSCDETSAAVTCGYRVLSNVISSQIELHKKYGGVYPALAKRAHEERIDWVVEEALRRAGIASCKVAKFQSFKEKNSATLKLCHSASLSAIAVTQGPGLAIALEVGIKKAKEIITSCKVAKLQRCKENDSATLKLCHSETPRLIAINHLEGHIYSCFAVGGRKTENGKQIADCTENGNLSDPSFCNLSSVLCHLSSDKFPSLCLIVSGGHTELVLMKDHGKYEVVGETLDDACGEALDKAAKILKLGYPGGPIIERLAEEYLKKGCGWEMGSESGSENEKWVKKNQNSPSLLTPDTFLTSHPHPKYSFSQSLPQKSNLNFSYSGLKTQFFYLVQKMAEEEFDKNLTELAFSFQSACFDQIIRKTFYAIRKYQPKTLITGGGVIANKYLRKLLRRLGREYNIPVLFPPKKNLITDNAAMIGLAAYHKFQRKEFVEDIESLDREPRLCL